MSRIHLRLRWKLRCKTAHRLVLIDCESVCVVVTEQVGASSAVEQHHAAGEYPDYSARAVFERIAHVLAGVTRRVDHA